jgi:hypothetical protein
MLGTAGDGAHIQFKKTRHQDHAVGLIAVVGARKLQRLVATNEETTRPR